MAGETAIESPAQPGIATSVAVPTTVVSEVTVAPSEQILAELPVAADPCVEPAAHQLVDVHEYGFMFEGEERPVGVRMGGEAALSDPVIFVGLHGAGRAWKGIPLLMNLFAFDTMVASRDQVAIFAPQAESGDEAFWGQSESFNVDFLTEFFALMARSVCARDSTVILFGAGQGAVVAAEGVCRANLPVDLVLLLQGMAKLTECSPANPIPIVSLDQYEFHPGIGPYWDGDWNPPAQLEIDLTGGINATPEDLAVWADIYRCPGSPVEEQLPDPGGVLKRPTTVLSYLDCDAGLVAFGMESAEGGQGLSPIARRDAWSRVESELRALLGEG